MSRKRNKLNDEEEMGEPKKKVKVKNNTTTTKDGAQPAPEANQQRRDNSPVNNELSHSKIYFKHNEDTFLEENKGTTIQSTTIIVQTDGFYGRFINKDFSQSSSEKQQKVEPNKDEEQENKNPNNKTMQPNGQNGQPNNESIDKDHQ
mmetsp:Transcript_323/g.587  ORF Transcript_323/g.587 Transcript_323/m.587 type:complete len:147 (-) Transcript_323:352-792(-)